MSFSQEDAILFENSSDSIIVLQGGLLKHINSKGFAMLGYEPDEIINHHFGEFVYKEDLSLVLERYKKRIKNEPIPEVYPFRLVSKNGKIIWFEIHAIEIEWDGAPASLTFFNDISRRKEAEAVLLQRESQIRAVLDAIPDMMIQVKKDGTILKYRPSKSMATHFKDDYTERHIRDIVPTAFYDKCISKINSAFSTKEVQVFEFSLDFDDGKRYLEARIVAFNEDEILALLRDITNRKLNEEKLRKNQENLENENKRLRSSLKGSNSFEGIIGKSKAMEAVFEQILKAASSSAPVIIYGESGTGKELVSRAIHELSDRTKNSFVPVNCGAIPENLLESEFFGYKKGAFSGAVSDKKGFLHLADSGTLFMDELGEIAMPMQIKLLRAIEGSGFIPVGGDTVCKPDVRIIGATNKNPETLMRKGVIREDFYYRVNVIQINLPPLRERLDDLPLLVYHFFEKFGKEGEFPSIPKNIMVQLKAYLWPGNIRELQNVIHRYITMGRIDLPSLSVKQSAFSGLPRENNTDDFKTALRNFEKDYILKALEEHRWQKGKVATLLGIHRKTLFRKIKELGIE